MMTPTGSSHFTNPITAGIDIIAAASVLGWWFEAISKPVGVITTIFAGLWYAYCLFDAIEKRIRRRK